MAKSELAGVTASMSVFSLVMNCMTMSLIWNSMSGGWSPTWTLVRPGRSTNVRLRTEGERERERERHFIHRAIHVHCAIYFQHDCGCQVDGYT